MENKNLLKAFILTLGFVGLAVALAQWETQTSARTQIADNAWTGAAGGSWNTTDANWTNPTIWNNANVDSAIFGAVPIRTVLASVPITLRGMRFDADGYTVTPPGALTFAAGGGGSLAPGEIHVGPGFTTHISNALKGTVGMTKTGEGTLVLFNSSPSDYTGTTTISGGKLQIGFGVGGSLGNIPDNPVNMAANTTLEFNRSQSFNFSGLITAANGSSVAKSGAS